MKHVLLVLPERHPLFASDVCGGRLPRVSFRHQAGSQTKPCPVCGAKLRWSPAPTTQTDSLYVCSTDWKHSFKQEDVLNYAWYPGDQGGNDYSRQALALPLLWNESIQSAVLDRLLRYHNALHNPQATIRLVYTIWDVEGVANQCSNMDGAKIERVP